MVGKMKEELILSKEDAEEILWEDADDFVTVRDTQTSSSRWSANHELIVKRLSDEKFFRALYSCGLTECQDERPWEYEETVKFTEVVPVEKTIIDYIEAE